jgi:U3 small nucleolar RNA-associated protein 14
MMAIIRKKKLAEDSAFTAEQPELGLTPLEEKNEETQPKVTVKKKKAAPKGKSKKASGKAVVASSETNEEEKSVKDSLEEETVKSEDSATDQEKRITMDQNSIIILPIITGDSQIIVTIRKIIAHPMENNLKTVQITVLKRVIISITML